MTSPDLTKAPRAPGRPRDSATDDAILNAALAVLEEEECYSYVTIEKIAARAGVGKPTIYRRWKTKADIVLDAFAARAANRNPVFTPTEDAFQDLQGFLERLFIVTAHPTTNRAIRGFIAESQYDEEFRRKHYDRFLAQRRSAMMAILRHGQTLGQVRADLDMEVACDLIYGAFAARLMHSALPLDAAFAASLVDTLRLGFGASRRV